MKYFLDTSVFVAAFWGDHPQHDTTAAAKSGADVIYTWDVDDFQRVSPAPCAGRIRTP